MYVATLTALVKELPREQSCGHIDMLHQLLEPETRKQARYCQRFQDFTVLTLIRMTRRPEDI
jgi:hypothetical protein